MNNYLLEGTPKTPHINFDAVSGIMQISGRSIPENALDFYKPLMKWLKEYAACPLPESTLVVRMEYFNTSSSKCLIDIFRRLEKIHLNGVNVYVKWYYETEDEDMKHSGEDFKEIVNLPIQLLELEEKEG